MIGLLLAFPKRTNISSAAARRLSWRMVSVKGSNAMRPLSGFDRSAASPLAQSLRGLQFNGQGSGVDDHAVDLRRLGQGQGFITHVVPDTGRIPLERFPAPAARSGGQTRPIAPPAPVPR